MTEATLFVGGRVYSEGRYAEALLLEDGRVVAAGPEASVRRRAAVGTERVDLNGRLVVPGLADAHLHLGELAREGEAFDARPAGSVEDLTGRLRRWAEGHPGGALAGRGLDVEALVDRRWPTVEELDRAVPDRPLVLFHASGHAAVLNSRALTATYGIEGPRPGNGPLAHLLVEDRLADVRPIVHDALPLRAEAVEATLRSLAALGITSVGTMNTGPDELAVLGALAAAGRSPVRVRAYPAYRTVADRTAPELSGASGFFGIAGVKMFLDGAFGPRTASLAAPYSDDPSTRGVDREEDGELSGMIEDVRRRGLTPALHAIGDRAVARALRLLGSGPPVSRRGRIEHASLTPPSLLPGLRELGLPLVVQPGFLRTDLWLPRRLGPERARWAYAFRSLSDQGIPLAGSSDAPFDALDPWTAMRTAVRRADGLGRSANPSPDQALSVPEAFALYTTGSHRAIGDVLGGALAAGGPADLLILSSRSLDAAVSAEVLPVRETWVDGAPVVPGP